MEKVIEKVLKVSAQEWLALAVYPMLLLYRTPIAWMASLWEARRLLNGQWHRYMGFHPVNSLNSFYYRTLWLNINRYGMNGRSPVIGLGNYSISRWFHISILSIYVYANAGAATMLGGTLAWVVGHLIWMEAVEPLWVILVSVTVFLSTTTYAMAFARQNYNVLGWMWLPIALFAATNGYWTIAAFSWFAASLGSITVIFVAVPLMLVLWLATGESEVVLTLIPAMFKLALHFVPMILSGGFRKGLSNMAKLIGFTEREVRYKRTSKSLGLLNIYFILLYVFGCFLLWLSQEQIPLLPTVATTMFLINQRFVRFADDQSIIMLMLTVFTAHLMGSDPNMLLLGVLWLVASPLPIFLGVSRPSGVKKQRASLAKFQPFDHTRLESAMEQFFEDLPEGSKVLFAFSDPSGVYENLFDGYRRCIELPLFVAAGKGVHLFPDWWAVAETNYQVHQIVGGGVRMMCWTTRVAGGLVM